MLGFINFFIFFLFFSFVPITYGQENQYSYQDALKSFDEMTKKNQDIEVLIQKQKDFLQNLKAYKDDTSNKRILPHERKALGDLYEKTLVEIKKLEDKKTEFDDYFKNTTEKKIKLLGELDKENKGILSKIKQNEEIEESAIGSKGLLKKYLKNRQKAIDGRENGNKLKAGIFDPLSEVNYFFMKKENKAKADLFVSNDIAIENYYNAKIINGKTKNEYTLFSYNDFVIKESKKIEEDALKILKDIEKFSPLENEFLEKRSKIESAKVQYSFFEYDENGKCLNCEGGEYWKFYLNCSDKRGKFYQLEKHPELILIGTESESALGSFSLNSIAKFDLQKKQVSNLPDIAYKCKNMSMFGCGDDQKKSLCSVIDSCKSVLEQISTYTKDHIEELFFENTNDVLELNIEKLRDQIFSINVTIADEDYKKDSKKFNGAKNVGLVTTQFFDELLFESKKIKAKNIKEYTQKFNALKNEILKKLKSTHKEVLSYSILGSTIFDSINRGISFDDVLGSEANDYKYTQEALEKKCMINSSSILSFCELNQKFNKAYQDIGPWRTLENQAQCPSIVLRDYKNEKERDVCESCREDESIPLPKIDHKLDELQRPIESK